MILVGVIVCDLHHQILTEIAEILYLLVYDIPPNNDNTHTDHWTAHIASLATHTVVQMPGILVACSHAEADRENK